MEFVNIIEGLIDDIDRKITSLQEPSKEVLEGLRKEIMETDRKIWLLKNSPDDPESDPIQFEKIVNKWKRIKREKMEKIDELLPLRSGNCDKCKRILSKCPNKGPTSCCKDYYVGYNCQYCHCESDKEQHLCYCDEPDELHNGCVICYGILRDWLE